MNSQLTQSAIDSAVADFQQIDYETRCFWASVTSLKTHLAERMKSFMAATRLHRGNALHLDNALGNPLNEIRCRTELANEKTLIDYLVASPEYAEADQLVRPAVEKVREAEAAHAEAVNAENRAEAARIEAIEAAKARAVAEVEAQYAVAQPEVAPEPARPFRGKGLKVATEAEAEAQGELEPSFA